VAVLFFAQAVLGSQLQIMIVLGGLAGVMLASNPALATLPISLVMFTAVFGAPLASNFMGKCGRRLGFLVGASGGCIGGLLAAISLFISSFDLLLLGSVFTGIYYSFHGFYRFAAADTASDSFRPTAISWVLAGGLVGAMIGSEVVQNFSDFFSPVPFAGAYGVVVLLNIIGGIGVLFLKIPLLPTNNKNLPVGRPLKTIICQPETIVAMLCGMISYGVMALVMTSTSLAMVEHGFTSSRAADVVRWHALFMFGPSFFTGIIISRFGNLRIMALGLLMLGVSCFVAISGVELRQFYTALILLGFGWNFSFIGATTLLANTYRENERAKVQGLNDFLVLGAVSMASFLSGALLNYFGWPMVQIAAMPPLLVAVISLSYLAIYRRGKIEIISS
tara:strand:- start:11831 stop:13003 length:1173 start_codon:yes stop_codon:yes gene_type:complete